MAAGSPPAIPASCAVRLLPIHCVLSLVACNPSVSMTLAWLSQPGACWRRSRDLLIIWLVSTLSHSTALNVRAIGLSGEHL